MIVWTEKALTIGALNPGPHEPGDDRVSSIEYRLFSGAVQFAMLRTIEADDREHPKVIEMMGKLGRANWSDANAIFTPLISLKAAKEHAEAKLHEWLDKAQLQVRA